MTSRLRVLGVDAALANMGIAFGELTLDASVSVSITDLTLIRTFAEDRKVVRKSSSDLGRSQELVAALHEAIQQWKPTHVFAEVPSGAQSAAAARALGIATGVLGSIIMTSAGFVEVSPAEVKRVVMGEAVSKATRKGPSKDDMIAWARKRWPEAPWRLNKTGKRAGSLLAENEHLADACAVIEAGIRTPEFSRVLSFLKQRQPSRRRIEL